MDAPRPSTSGGLSTSGSATKTVDFNKRMSKDDMFFNGTRRTAVARQTPAGHNRTSRDDMYIRSRMAAMSQFHVPVRGSTLTPEHSPDYSLASEPSIPIRTQTPESMTSGEIPIGMAIGSPVPAQSEPSRWQAQFPPASPLTETSIQTETTLVASEPSPAVSVPAGSLQRKKTGRRKLFGLFGAKKNVDQPVEAGAQRDQEGAPLTKNSSSPKAPKASKASKTPMRSYTQSDRKPSKHKPILLRSATLPYEIEEQQLPNSMPNSSGPPSLRLEPPSEPSARENNAYQRPPPSMPSIPRLDVQIPDTKLERYSVMFSDVLKQGPRHEQATSLLARRQATLERLKTINDEVAAQEAARPRRATSPQPQLQPPPRPQYLLQQQPASSMSPRLSIFPVPPTTRVTPSLDTPTSHSRVSRSNTSPGRLPSPVQQTFDTRPRPSPAKGTSQQHLGLPNPFEMNPPNGRPRPSRSQEPIYPTDTSFHFGPDQSGLILDSPSSIASHEEIVISQPFKPTLHEPQWQMISPSTTSSFASLGGGRRVRSPSTASASTHVTKPSSEFDAADLALQNAVEVSIARQISVSRQQRQLLRPLQTRRGADGRPNGAVSPAAGSVSDSRSPIGVTVVKAPSPSRLGRDEPIREVQSATPTLRESPVAPEHRKSSWVVLESD